MIPLLTQVDWNNIKDILGGTAVFIFAMFWLYVIFWGI